METNHNALRPIQRSLSEFCGIELLWVKSPLIYSQRELRFGEEVLATMRVSFWRFWVGEGETREGALRVRFSLFNQSITIYNADSGVEIATFRRRVFGGLDSVDPRYQLKHKSIASRGWVVLDGNDQLVMEFSYDQAPGQPTLRIAPQQAGVNHDLPMLVLLAGFIQSHDSFLTRNSLIGLFMPH